MLVKTGGSSSETGPGQIGDHVIYEIYLIISFKMLQNGPDLSININLFQWKGYDLHEHCTPTKLL